MNSNPSITLRIIDGNDKGKIFENLTFPVSLGREKENKVQIHDEKVSRYHCKIQTDGKEIFLTDLDSTNGTQLNGQRVHAAPIYCGDLISLGQTLLIVGSRKEIAERLASLENLNLNHLALRFLASENRVEHFPQPLIDEYEEYSYDVRDALQRLHAILPPELPDLLSIPQTAKFCEFLLYFQIRLKLIAEKAIKEAGTETVTLEQKEWQSLLDILSRFTDYYSTLTNQKE